MEQPCYIYEGNVQKGPFALDEVTSMAERGQVSKEALYWQSGMSEWKPLASLNAFIPPHPIINGKDRFEEEYNGPLYRTARLQKHVIIAFVLAIMMGSLTAWTGNKGNVAMAVYLGMSGVFLYGLVYFVLFHSALYGAWKTALFCGLSLIIPVILFVRIAMAIDHFRRQCREHDLKLDWAGNLRRAE